MNIQKIKCKIGLHDWERFKDYTVDGEYSASLGGYIFNPSTKIVYVCPHCGARREEVYDFKGDRER